MQNHEMQHPGAEDKQTKDRGKSLFLVLILGALYVITPFSIDMYLPGFPEIARDLGTSLGTVSFSVSSYFAGFALGQIFYGPLLDRFGRKPPLYLGLVVYILSSIGCFTASSIGILIGFRFIQAFGGCVASVAAIAMVRDFFPVEEGARVFSLLILILGVSPLLAPSIGGMIVTAWGWQWVFGLLAVIVLLILGIVFFFLPEGHGADPAVSLRFAPVAKGFLSIFLEPQFYVYALSGSFSFAGLFVYVTGSPEIFMSDFHLGARAYGGVFALLATAFIGGSQLNHILTRRYPTDKIFKTTLIFQVLAGLVFLTGALGGWYGIIATISLLFILLLCSGVSNPNASALALAPFPGNAGSASALWGFLQIGLGALASMGVGTLHMKGTTATALVMAVSSAAGLLILLAGEKRIVRMIRSDEIIPEIF